MNDWSAHLLASVQDLGARRSAQASPSSHGDEALGRWAARCERAAGLSSGLAVENEIMDIAREINESGLVRLESLPALSQALEAIRLRWKRAGSCCRR